MGIKKVAVVGGGRMGRQRALNAAINGYRIIRRHHIPPVCDGVDLISLIPKYFDCLADGSSGHTEFAGQFFAGEVIVFVI